MGKTRDLIKKMRDTKGTLHANMASIKDRNGRDLTEVEDIKRWQEYTEKLQKRSSQPRKSWECDHSPRARHPGMWSQVGLRKHHYKQLVEVMEFQLSYFTSWKMMLWKCCTQYASKFGKLSSGHRTGKGQFSFKSQRKAIPKNAQTTAQLHSSHTLVKWCSKFSKPGFNSTWTMNFQMFKLVLEKAEEPEIKLPKSAGSSKKQKVSRKISISALSTTPKPLIVWITINWKILKQLGIPYHLSCLLRNLDADQEATVRTGYGTKDWFQIGKGAHQGCILSLCLFNLYAEYIMRNAVLDEA